MIGLVQRVERASVEVGGRVVGEIGAGLLAFVCAEPGDGDASASRFVDKLLALRILADDAGRMNRSLAQTGGGLLVVSQFTLAADTSSGNRPGFDAAAPPAHARAVYERVLGLARERHAPHPVAAGEFGASMRVALVNDGPVTIPLRVR